MWLFFREAIAFLFAPLLVALVLLFPTLGGPDAAESIAVTVPMVYLLFLTFCVVSMLITKWRRWEGRIRFSLTMFGVALLFFWSYSLLYWPESESQVMARGPDGSGSPIPYGMLMINMVVFTFVGALYGAAAYSFALISQRFVKQVPTGT